MKSDDKRSLMMKNNGICKLDTNPIGKSKFTHFEYKMVNFIYFFYWMCENILYAGAIHIEMMCHTNSIRIAPVWQTHPFWECVGIIFLKYFVWDYYYLG